MKEDNSNNKEMCPMSSMCKGMMKRSGSKFLLMLPGGILIIIGILILMKPQILFWLVAGASILMGVIMLLFANFMRKIVSD
jgi:hypothetical protein